MDVQGVGGHQESILNTIKDLYSQQTFSDIIVISSQKTYNCHKVILSSKGGWGVNLKNSNRIDCSKIEACGFCEGCQKEECGICGFCQDMPKFGGYGKLKKKCKFRTCSNQIQSRNLRKINKLEELFQMDGQRGEFRMCHKIK